MAEESDRMAVLRLLKDGRINSDSSVTLLRALAQAGAGGMPDPGAEERRMVLQALEDGRVSVEEAVSLLKALRAAGMGGMPDAGRDERVTVLEMLRDQRVGVDEALALLRALCDPASVPAPEPRGVFRRVGDSANPEQWERTAQRAVARARRAADFWSQHAEEIAGRAGKAAEQVGENMGRVLAGVPDIVERMAKAGWGTWGPGYRFEDVVEGVLAPGEQATLDLEGWNGMVAVRPVEGDRVRLVLRKTVHAPNEEDARQVADAVEAVVDGESRRVRVARRSGLASWPGGLSLEAYVPRGVEWTGDVRTGNGAVEVDGLRVRGLRLETSNGMVRVDGCSGEDLSATTSNGRIEVTGALAGRVDLRTSNGAIVVTPSGESGGEPWLRATTSNGPIELRLPATVAVDLDAATSNGKFDLSGLGPDGPDLRHQKSFGRNEVRWRSPSWDQSTARLTVQLRTSNGAVRVG